MATLRTFISIFGSTDLLQKTASHVLIFVISVLTEMLEVVVRAEDLLQSSRVCALSIALKELSGVRLHACLC